MELLGDDRAQAVQVGAVLLFGILVILFAVWQTFVIPDQNEQVEFSHNQEVQSEMVELRGDIVSTADATTPTSASVELGTQFPARLLFINPSPAAGSLQTERVGEGEIRIENAVATQEDSLESAFWNGNARAYETTSLEYSPDYRVFGGAPDTVYDNTVTYNVFEDGDEGSSALSEQAIISGDTITLVSLVGEYSESDIGSVTVDIQPVNTNGPSVEVENDEEDGPITIEVSTKLGESQWEQLLEEEENVESVDENENTVEIELAEGQYNLQLAQIGIGEGLSDPEPAYITPVEGFEEPLPPGGEHTFTVEVRDRFNSPVSDVDLEGEVEDEDEERESEFVEDSDATDTEGLATFTLDVDDEDQGDEIDLLFTNADGQSWDDEAEEDGFDEFETRLDVADPEEAGEDEALGLRWEDTPNGWKCKDAESEGAFVCSNVPPGGASGDITVNATGSDAEAGDVVQLVNTNTDSGEFQDTDGIFWTVLEEDEDGNLVSELQFETDDGFEQGDSTTLVGHISNDVAALVLEVDPGDN